jgi:hypothetical protein
MKPNLIGIVFVLVALVVVFRWMDSGSVMKEGFTFPVAEHQDFVEDSQKKLNSLTNMINLTSPIVSVDTATAQSMYGATHGVKPTGTVDEYSLKPETLFEVPEAMPTALQQAIGCQKAPTTCGAFDDPMFATNCGMSFDREGIGSDGKPHVGGLFVASDDRQIQTERARKVRETGAPPYDPYKVYQPSLGIAKPGTFALTKDQCVVVKEKVDCEAKQTFNSPNCTQCFPSQGFARVGPETPRLPSLLYVQGQGTVSVQSPDGSISLPSTALSTDSVIKVQIPADAEGKTFLVEVTADTRIPTYLSGYLEGQTGRGAFKLDLNALIQSDLETQAKPKMMGTKKVNGFRALSFVPGTKKTRMRLSCLMPFSFLNMYEPDAITCDNGPVITKEASARFLESDPCFGKANQPGNYKLECLQSRWMALGGTPEGTGYPSTPEKAMALQRQGGRAMVLDDIMDTLSTKITAAITGKRANGTQMDVPEWNELSMWALGVPIQSPCDGIQKDGGPLSKECLAYLYDNRGSVSPIGPTYSMPADKVASKKGALEEGWQDSGVAAGASTYAYPDAPLDPRTATGFAAGQSLGGVEAVKARYDAILRNANDNSKGNTQRALDVKQAYGIDLPPPSSNAIPGPTQVYVVGPDYRYTKGEANGVCARFGAKVATTAQLEEAQRAGADWCFSGWVADGDGKWPITTNPIPGCGWMGINSWTWQDENGVPKAGVNCYGPKPRPTEVKPSHILPFNGDLWDQPTEKTYITVPSGYLESSGPQPACFNGLSPDEAKKGCDRLGGQCVGFSYSKDGGGHGCYKGNHAAGLNRNGAYMGYVKVPSGGGSEPVDGRYIRLDYNHVECLNLAQILVFSTPGGKNIITPETKVTKSSGYQGDVFPSQNVVNQKGNQFYNFIHTSCGDVPWMEVDLGSTVRIHKIVVWNRVDCCQSRILGTVLSVLNEEKEKVYIANPITTTNQSYTWMPPSGEVQVDKDPIPAPDEMKVYGNNGSTSCEQYCRGTGGGPWNNELPAWWNGAKCSGHSPSIPNCNSGFRYDSSTYCVCEKTGTGWDTRGWRGP